VCPEFLIGGKTKGPKIEAELPKAKSGWGSWGGGSKPPSHQLEAL